MVPKIKVDYPFLNAKLNLRLYPLDKHDEKSDTQSTKVMSQTSKPQSEHQRKNLSSSFFFFRLKQEKLAGIMRLQIVFPAQVCFFVVIVGDRGIRQESLPKALELYSPRCSRANALIMQGYSYHTVQNIT